MGKIQLCNGVEIRFTIQGMMGTGGKGEQVQVYTRASDFFQRCSPFLCEREAENNLILGIGSILGTPSSPYENVFLASVGSPQLEGAFLMTPPHKMLISSPASDMAMQMVVDAVMTTGRPVSGINGPAAISEHFARLWASTTRQDVQLSIGLFCYKLSSVRNIPRSSGSMRKAAHDDFALLVDWSKRFDADAGVHQREESLISRVVRNGIEEGHYYLWVNREPVSLARASGTTPTGIRISSVYTPSEHREHGYASSLVADVSQFKLNEGRKFCFLFTDAENPTSNKIYQRIGYKQVCKFQEYSFTPSASV